MTALHIKTRIPNECDGAALRPEERNHAARILHHGTRRAWISSRHLLRTLLTEHLGDGQTPVAYQPSGRPWLPQFPQVALSLSHTTGLVACALCDGAPTTALGIDVEAVERPLDALRLSQRFFAADETTWLQQHPISTQAIAFIQLWTLKEAVLKAMGTGLSGGLDTFSVRPNPPRLIHPPDSAKWHVRQWCDNSGHIVALAKRQLDH